MRGYIPSNIRHLAHPIIVLTCLMFYEKEKDALSSCFCRQLMSHCKKSILQLFIDRNKYSKYLNLNRNIFQSYKHWIMTKCFVKAVGSNTYF